MIGRPARNGSGVVLFIARLVGPGLEHPARPHVHRVEPRQIVPGDHPAPGDEAVRLAQLDAVERVAHAARVREVRLREGMIQGEEVRVAYTWVKVDVKGASQTVLVQVAETLERAILRRASLQEIMAILRELSRDGATQEEVRMALEVLRDQASDQEVRLNGASGSPEEFERFLNFCEERSRARPGSGPGPRLPGDRLWSDRSA